MKKLQVICLVYLILGIAFFVAINIVSPKDFNGYFRTLDFVRVVEPYYEGAELIHTEKAGEQVVDFLLGEDGILRVVNIKVKDTKFGERYKERETLGFYADIMIQECMEKYDQDGEIPWKGVSEYKKVGVFWTILASTCEVTDSDVSAHEFYLNGEQYVLYVKNSTGDGSVCDAAP